MVVDGVKCLTCQVEHYGAYTVDHVDTIIGPHSEDIMVYECSNGHRFQRRR